MSTGVIIVGAGAAGLYAANILQQNGREVTVLEARDRIGGRLLSPVVAGGSVDLGATWFWENEARINAFITDAELPAFDQYIAGDMIFQPSPRGAQRMDGNQLSTPAGRLSAGMASLTEALGDQLDPGTVKLATEVRSINPDHAGLSVESATERWSAEHVVLALPPALAIARIDFGGSLNGRIAALARATPVWMGATVKAVAVFEQPFWRDTGLAGAAYSYSGPMREIHDMSGPDGTPAALFGFCNLPTGSPPPSIEDVTRQFVELFGEAAANPTDVFVMDWRAEEFTSPPEVESITNYQTYGHREFQSPNLGGRLHWASTETSTIAPGHIEGAFTAAQRAADAILSSPAQ